MSGKRRTYYCNIRLLTNKIAPVHQKGDMYVCPIHTCFVYQYAVG